MKKLFLVLSIFAIVALPAMAISQVVPDSTYVEGNPKCENEWKDDNPSNGTFNVSVNGGTITYTITNMKEISWSSTFPIQTVIVKAGPGANIYDYGPNGATSGSGLLTPFNNGGNRADLSHVSFCYEESEEEYGALKIIKQVFGIVDQAFNITFDVYDSQNALVGSPVVNVPAGTDPSGNILVEDLEPGIYVVKEPDVPGYSHKTPAEVQVVVAANDTAEVTFENEQEQEYGDLNI
ncbi:hypothetical protein JW935_17260, partial [candidate division KSB1 bacterium]|nr:hypothetical protein [candidate division KSB1 bacterium]